MSQSSLNSAGRLLLIPKGFESGASTCEENSKSRRSLWNTKEPHCPKNQNLGGEGENPTLEVFHPWTEDLFAKEILQNFTSIRAGCQSYHL